MYNATSEDDVYTEHLTKISADNKVVSTEDIFSSKGVLLVSKDTVIDDKAALQIAKHKLKKSVSLCVTVENVIDEKQVYAAFQTYFDEFPDIKSLHEKLELKTRLQVGCIYFKEFPLLAQKITVMEHNLPELYKKAIGGAWFALAIGSQLGLEALELKQIFVAALVRDVGMMHIEPELLKSSAKDFEAMRKLIMGHVLIGKLVLNEVDKLPALIKKAIYEHHERCDGAGYPVGKQGKDLSLEGQVLAMSDTIQEILCRYQSQGRNIANLEGFFILNTTTYGEKVYKALVRLAKMAEVEPNRTIDDSVFSDFMDKLLDANRAFMDVCTRLNQLNCKFKQNNPQKEEMVLKNFINRIVDMRVKSGVPSEEYGRWIEYVKNNNLVESYGEMEMLGTMFDELAWQIDQIRVFISIVWQSDGIEDDRRSLLEDCMTAINNAIKITDFKATRG